MWLRFHFLLVLLVAAAWLRADARSDQEKRLKDTFVGKIVTIRNFYVDDKLVYSPAAKVVVGGTPGDWTLAHFRVEKIRLTPDQLTLEGRRVRVVYEKKSDDLVNILQGGDVNIEIQLDRGHAADADLTDLLDHVFLTERDKLEDLVPEPWPAIIKEQRQADTVVGGEVYKINGAVKAPHVRKPVPEPEFPQEARAQRIEGTVILLMVVDVDGRPKNIRVVRSAGHGFDEAAVQAARHYRFEPATKDGHPVPVLLNVEVSFRVAY